MCAAKSAMSLCARIYKEKGFREIVASTQQVSPKLYGSSVARSFIDRASPQLSIHFAVGYQLAATVANNPILRANRFCARTRS